jgi:hypothetical protein
MAAAALWFAPYFHEVFAPGAWAAALLSGNMTRQSFFGIQPCRLPFLPLALAVPVPDLLLRAL